MRAAPFLVCFFLFSCSPPSPVGVEPEPDAPIEPVDAGAVVDSGTAEVDAGQRSEDAGVTPLDAGTDAGVDAGVDAGLDAGFDAGVDAGQPCRCTLPSFCSNNVCVVDATTPAITVTASAGSTSGKLRVTGTATDGETGITSVSVSINQGVAVTLPVTMGTFSGELDSTDPEFVVVVTGRDAAGNEGVAQSTFDPTGPRISLSPADGNCDASGCSGAIINASTTSFTITATIEELALAPTSPVTIRVVTTTGTQIVPTTDMQRSGSSWIWTWSNLPTLDLMDLHFVVTATDAAQNVSSATVFGSFDRIGPVITMTPAQDGACNQTGCSGAVVTSATNSFVFSGTVEAIDMRIRIRDGASVVVPSSEVSINMGTWSWTWSAPPLVDGRPMTAEITATDRLGNTTTASRIVLVDRVAPSVLAASPLAGALVGTPTVAVAANAADGLGIKAVEVTTSSGSAITPATLDANGDYVANVGVPVVDAVEQTLTFRAVDLVGNSRSTTRRYIADRVAPVVSIAGGDFDCAGPVCSGMVANGSTSSVAFNGTATDGSPVSLQKSIFGTTQLVTSTDPVSGGAWSWSWSSLPANVNGAAYELRVIATDAAGNASAPSVRRVWLDNVAPTVTVPSAGQRNVNPTAPVFVFSERMFPASVPAGLSVSPTVNTASLATTDGRTFAFPVSVLAPYTSYQVNLTSAFDIAGNGLSAMRMGTFLTAPVQRAPTTVVMPPLGAITYRHPAVAVDSDGQLYVSATASGSSNAVVESVVLSGTGERWSRSNSWVNSAREGEMRVVGEVRNSEQRLIATIEHALVFGNGGNPTVGYGTQTGGWTAQGYETAFQLTSSAAPTVGGNVTTLDLVRPVIDWVPSALGPRRNIVAPNNGATAMNSLDQNTGSGWTTTTPAALTSLRRLDGRASVESTTTLGQYRVRYYDLGAMSEVGSFGFVRAVTGQPALKRVDQFTTVANSGGFLAWLSDTQLTIACSPAPFVASPVWRSTVFPMPPTQSSTLTSTRDNTKVVFASEFGGSVYVHSTPLNGCTAAPLVKELRVIPGLKEPNVFIDSRGIVWVAGIATDGAVVVHQI